MKKIIYFFIQVITHFKKTFQYFDRHFKKRRQKSEFRKMTLDHLDTLKSLPKQNRKEYLKRLDYMENTLGFLGRDFVARKRFFNRLQNFFN